MSRSAVLLTLLWSRILRTPGSSGRPALCSFLAHLWDSALMPVSSPISLVRAVFIFSLFPNSMDLFTIITYGLYSLR